MQISNNGIPRRNRIDLNTPAELAIRKAIIAVEQECPGHTLVTDVVVLLAQAKDKLADYIERD